MTAHRRLAVLVAHALAGCDDGAGDSITKIDRPRVLAITSEPSVMPLEGELALTAVIVDPDGPRHPGDRPVDAIRMRACAPWRFIADPARDCAGADALPLREASGGFTTSAAELAAVFPAPPGVPAPPDPWRAALAAGVQLRVPIVVEVDVDGQTLVAQRDIEVAVTGERENPRFAGLLFDGVPATTLRAGQRYALVAAFEGPTFDEDPGTGALERVVCNFYSATGELEEPESSVEQPDAPRPVTAPIGYLAGAPGATWIFAVATDQTGGMTATALRIAVE